MMELGTVQNATQMKESFKEKKGNTLPVCFIGAVDRCLKFRKTRIIEERVEYCAMQFKSVNCFRPSQKGNRKRNFQLWKLSLL